MTLEEVKNYLESKNVIEFDNTILENLSDLKKVAVYNFNETLANEIWFLEQVFKIKSKYVNMFEMLKSEKYYDAWCVLEQIEIIFSNIRANYDNYDSKFNLKFIEKTINYYEKTFPYQYFFSRETIVKKEKCTICGKINTIRNRCEHKVGKLYMGEMCHREVVDFEFLGLAIVKNPLDKYTVLFPDKKEYDYFMLSHIMENLNSPYDQWYIETYKVKNPIYKKIGRNDKCPCGSNIKYKNCCLGTENEYIDHNKIIFLDNPNPKPLPFTLINTWKN